MIRAIMVAFSTMRAETFGRNIKIDFARSDRAKLVCLLQIRARSQPILRMMVTDSPANSEMEGQRFHGLIVNMVEARKGGQEERVTSTTGNWTKGTIPCFPETFWPCWCVDCCRPDVVKRTRESYACRTDIRSLDIKTPSGEQKMLNLSGGNQQNVVIAKWVARRPRTLIVDEPTRSIDVGANAEVHALLNKRTEEGMSIVMVFSDLPEVLAVSDRVVVLKKGHITGILPRGDTKTRHAGRNRMIKADIKEGLE